jgi:hypothetical protein
MAHKVPHGLLSPANIFNPVFWGFALAKPQEIPKMAKSACFRKGKKQEMHKKRRPGPHEDPKPPKTSQYHRNKAKKHLPQ